MASWRPSLDIRVHIDHANRNFITNARRQPLNPNSKPQGPDRVKKGTLPMRPNPREPRTSIAIVPVKRELPAKLADAIKELPPELVPTYQALEKLFDGHAQTTMIRYYEAGLLVKNCQVENVTSGKRLNRTDKVVALAKALDIPYRWLSDAVELVDAYTPEEYAALVRRKPISWGHVVQLLKVDNKSFRQKLADRVVDENLTVDELVRAMPGIAETKPRGPGRSPKVPRDIANALATTIRTANALNNRFENATFCEAFDLPSLIKDTPEDKVTAERRTQIEEAAAALEKVG
jgi:hypothetical protein